MSDLVENELASVKKRESKKKAVAITSPTILDAGNEGRRRRQRLLENEAKSGLTEDHIFIPKISDAIPNYTKLQKQFEDKLNKKKSMRPPTV